MIVTVAVGVEVRVRPVGRRTPRTRSRMRFSAVIRPVAASCGRAAEDLPWRAM